MSSIYGDLRLIARHRLRQLRPCDSFDTTGLVHEAYLRLVDIEGLQFEDRGHFFAVASILMRRILLNYARDRRALKRQGRLHGVPLDEERLLIPDEHADRLLELDRLLKIMDSEHPRQAAALAHRYFAGLRNGEIAELSGVSLATVERDLRFGRAWLAHRWTADCGDVST
jgi:RNA polymerase sigma factor (TIGR02999 family)